MAKENPDDFLQPDNPRFEKVYGHNPIREAKKENLKRENMKQDREDRIKFEAKKNQSKLSPADARALIREARARGLE